MAFFCVCNNISKISINKTIFYQYVYCILNRHSGRHFCNSPGKRCEIGFDVKECYAILNLNENCSLSELRSSFVILAKKYHPDGGTSTSDASKFARIETAYRTLREKLKEEQSAAKETDRNKTEDESDDKDYGIRHTAAQHRQYLSYDGVGYGTMSQRQKQHQSYKVNKAVETVFEHRTQKLAAQNEDGLIFKDKTEAKKHKIRNAIDRLVEDLIQESMSKGDFDNLPGKGRPLKHSSYNPYIDSVTQKLNEVLINNGFTPEWILLEKEIRSEVLRLRSRLESIRSQFGLQPLNESDSNEWISKTSQLRDEVAILNSKINKYNLVVPILKKQMVHFRLEREAEKILKTGKSNLDSKCEGFNMGQNVNTTNTVGVGSFLDLFSEIFRK